MSQVPFELGAMYWQNPNYGAKEVEEDMRRIRENNFTVIRAFVWWEQLERREGECDFAMHDILFDAAAKHGLKIMETFGLYLPIWLKKRLAAQGIEDKGRYACFDRPEVMGPMSNYVEKVVDRYKAAPALAIWNLWNEPTKAPCQCEHTLAKFVVWLKERYGNIEALKKAWLGEFTVFDTYCPDSFAELTVAWVQDAFRFANRGRNSPMEYDWLEFATDNLNDNLRWLSTLVRNIDPVHEHHANPCAPIGNGYHSGLNEWKLAKTLDSISASVHPSHFFFNIEKVEEFPCAYSFSAEEARGWAAGKDAWVGELQAGTTYYHPNKYTSAAADIDHHLWQTVGRGLKGVLFWEWQSWRSSMMEVGEFSLRRCHDGGPTERSDAAGKVGAVLRENEAVFRQARRPQSRVAVMISMAAKALKHMQGNNKPCVEGIGHDHNYAVYGCFKALNRANIAVDFVTEAQIEEGILERYRVLFLPHVEIMGRTTAGKLKDFVRGGGRLWADGRCAFLDEHVYLRHMIPGHGLDEMFGCREADFVAVRDTDRMTLGNAAELQLYRHMQYLEPVAGEVVATCNGRPAAVRNLYGRGMAEINGSYLTRGLQIKADPATMDYLAQFAFDAGVTPTLTISPRTGFEACLLTGPETDVMVITNHTGAATEAVIALPGSYRAVTCPQDGENRTVMDGTTIRRTFAVFETIVIFAEKA